MHFDFFVSNDSVANYDVHLGKYCSNAALLYGNWLNELTLSVSQKKILKNMPFFTESPPTPPKWKMNNVLRLVNVGVSKIRST